MLFRSVQTSQGWRGNTLILVGRGSVRLLGPRGGFVYRTAQFRDTYIATSPEAKRWKGEMKLAGTTRWVVLGEDSCTRIGGG